MFDGMLLQQIQYQFVLHDAYIQQVHKVRLGHMKKVKTVYRFYMFIAIHAIKIIRLVQGRSFENIIIFANIFFFFQVFHAPQCMHTLIKCSLVLDILDGMNNGTMYLTSSYGNTMNINLQYVKQKHFPHFFLMNSLVQNTNIFTSLRYTKYMYNISS